jgi:hypothetical protein
MKRSIYRIILPAILFVSLFSGKCRALEAEGYIIKENSDTVFGTIKLTKFQNGNVLLNGFNIESLQYQISFKEKDTHKFRTHMPGSIAGFGFTYDYEDYFFTSFIIDYKSVVPTDRQRNRFLCRVYKGKLNLYQNIITVNNPSALNQHNDFTTYYEFFVQNSAKGLLKVQKTKSIQSVRDLLKQFGVDEKFLLEIPLNTDMDEIRNVLQQYDNWLALQQVVL